MEPEALASTIAELARQSPARTRALGVPTWDDIAEQTLSVYRSVLAGHPSGC